VEARRLQSAQKEVYKATLGPLGQRHHASACRAYQERQRREVHRQSDHAAGRDRKDADAVHRAGLPHLHDESNGYAESFHSRLREELLNAEVFADVRQAKALAATWRNEYNHRRPHSSLGSVPSAVYAARLVIASPPLASPPARPAAYLITSMLNH